MGAVRRTPTLAAAAAALAAAAGLLAGGPAAAQGSLEFPIKAAFLTKFPAFVTWPNGASSDPLQLCIVGADPFGAALDQSVQASGGERPIVVRRMASVDRGSGCHMVYAAGSPRQSVAETLQAVNGEPVLTVTDAARGATRGMIHFIVFDNRVRFRIDASQAARNGISLSSKLLALGLSVKR